MTTPGTPTQVAHPWRSTLRTALQVTPSVLASIPLLVLAIEADNPGLTGGVGVFAIALAAGITRVMAVPQVNTWLTTLGLGATGKHPATGATGIEIEEP